MIFVLLKTDKNAKPDFQNSGKRDTSNSSVLLTRQRKCCCLKEQKKNESAALFLECYSKVAFEENRLSIVFIPLRIVP